MPMGVNQGDPLAPSMYVITLQDEYPGSPLVTTNDTSTMPHFSRRPTSPPGSAAGMLPPRSPPNLLHPRPVHYAPGPFPLFPDDPIAPPRARPITPPAPFNVRPIAPLAPFPAGPIAPLPPSHGSSGPRTMTRAPPGGWFPVQSDDPYAPYGNVQAEQLVLWTTADDNCVLIHFPGTGACDKGNYGRLCVAAAILKNEFGAPDATVTQPIAANPQPRPNAEPHYYRVGNLTIAQRERILRQQWASTTYGTFGAIAAPHDPPTFIWGFLHPERLGVTTEEGLAAAFGDGFKSAVLSGITINHITTDINAGGRWRHLTADAAFRLIIQSIRVRMITIREGRNDDKELVALLYIESPTADAAEWVNFRDSPALCRQLPAGTALPWKKSAMPLPTTAAVRTMTREVEAVVADAADALAAATAVDVSTMLEQASILRTGWRNPVTGLLLTPHSSRLVEMKGQEPELRG
ncbi:uncharacterized protein B0H18DRAFT_958762 [Fomitopsis serialis]|uniref:uncharacterized protein n=1 Tax=Fomitopsis serialis TaxID=139415 RepID=UPI002007D075|nr:uncharacterized protein B0H18DRAFT_958762 [Neoantrodia serialis]KAH9916627.1 hypothetical protein B0H18DRAFT_958762 [Neoantrodia serialis]